MRSLEELQKIAVEFFHLVVSDVCPQRLNILPFCLLKINKDEDES